MDHFNQTNGEEDFPITQQILQEANSWEELTRERITNRYEEKGVIKTNQQNLHERDNLERLLERMENINRYEDEDDEVFYDSRQDLRPQDQPKEEEIQKRKNLYFKKKKEKLPIREESNTVPNYVINNNNPASSRIGISHITLFTGTGNEFERIRDLSILFQELEDFYMNRNLTEEDKLALLKQKLAEEPKRAILEDRPATYKQAKRILLKDYTPEVKGENIKAKLKQVKKKGEEKFIRYAKRITSHAKIMADRLDLTIEHELIFLPITDALLQHFPDHVTSSDTIIKARRRRDIEAIINILEDITLDRPEWWAGQKEVPKIRTTNTTDLENIEYNTQDHEDKNSLIHQTKEEKIMEKPRKPCTYCHKLFHTEDQCWIKYPDKGPRNWRKWNNGYEQQGAHYRNYKRERYYGNKDEHNFPNRNQKQRQNF